MQRLTANALIVQERRAKAAGAAVVPVKPGKKKAPRKAAQKKRRREETEPEADEPAAKILRQESSFRAGDRVSFSWDGVPMLGYFLYEVRSFRYVIADNDLADGGTEPAATPEMIAQCPTADIEELLNGRQLCRLHDSEPLAKV